MPAFRIAPTWWSGTQRAISSKRKRLNNPVSGFHHGYCDLDPDKWALVLGRHGLDARRNAPISDPVVSLPPDYVGTSNLLLKGMGKMTPPGRSASADKKREEAISKHGYQIF